MPQSKTLEKSKYSDDAKSLSKEVKVEVAAPAPAPTPPAPAAVTPAPSASVTVGSGKFPRMAGFGDRFVALFLDSLILLGISFVFNLFSSFILGFLSTIDDSGVLAGFTSFGISLIGLVIGILYYGYFFTTKGWTLGGMAMKVKVVRADNLSYISWPKAIARQIMSYVGSMFFYLGYFWYFMSDKRQTWGDVAAGTYAVKTDPSGNIYMDGQEFYKKEPVKALLPAGCGCILMIITIVSVVALIGIAASSAGSKMGNYPSSNDFEDDAGTDFDYNYNMEDQNGVYPENTEDLDKLYDDLENKLKELEDQKVY